VDDLIILATHEYGLIARTAAMKLVRLLGSDSLRRLSKSIDDAVQEGHSSSCAEALRYAEMELYNVACLT
jgi:hypothetical protein